MQTNQKIPIQKMISNLSNEELKAQLLSSAYPSKLFNSLLLEELLTRIKKSYESNS